MITWQDFTIGAVRAIIIPPEQSPFYPINALGAILTHSNGKFDGAMQLWRRTDPPDDRPHVTLQSKEKPDGHRVLTMGPSRIESAWRSTRDGMSLPAEAADECADILARYIEATQEQVVRLALMVNRRCTVSNPAETLIERFCKVECKQQPFNRSESFEIHNFKTYKPVYEGVDYPINSWVRCRSVKMLEDNAPVVWVQHDLNTLANENRPFDSVRISAYFKMASIEANNIFRKYFP